MKTRQEGGSEAAVLWWLSPLVATLDGWVDRVVPRRMRRVQPFVSAGFFGSEGVPQDLEHADVQVLNAQEVYLRTGLVDVVTSNAGHDDPKGVFVAHSSGELQYGRVGLFALAVGELHLGSFDWVTSLGDQGVIG